MFVKICGINSALALAAAVEGGADAVGFVFAESPRRISPAAAAALCRDLPPAFVRVAVMLRPGADDWNEVRDLFHPDWLQADAGVVGDLDLGADCVALPVHRDTEHLDTANLPSPILYEGRKSGSGCMADWQLAAALAARTELILAGGLTPGNVAAAIEAVSPWGVDVSSGVESSPGTKDPTSIIAFIARARAAEKSL